VARGPGMSKVRSITQLFWSASDGGDVRGAKGTTAM
jgi:hypothetical protein